MKSTTTGMSLLPSADTYARIFIPCSSKVNIDPGVLVCCIAVDETVLDISAAFQLQTPFEFPSV
jgi:hypothetical protein